MKTVIHVNRHVIASNRKHGKSDPVLTVKTYKENRKGHEAVIEYNGTVIGRFIHRPDNPLSCGAVVWFETDNIDVSVRIP